MLRRLTDCGTSNLSWSACQIRLCRELRPGISALDRSCGSYDRRVWSYSRQKRESNGMFQKICVWHNLVLIRTIMCFGGDHTFLWYWGLDFVEGKLWRILIWSFHRTATRYWCQLGTYILSCSYCYTYVVGTVVTVSR